MARIILYTSDFCGYCRAAKQLLVRKGLEFEEIDVGFDQERRAELIQRAHGRRSMPQIFIDGTPIGGYQELAALDLAGKLDDWIANEPGAIVLVSEP
jgi:glutaredoxin 3